MRYCEKIIRIVEKNGLDTADFVELSLALDMLDWSIEKSPKTLLPRMEGDLQLAWRHANSADAGSCPYASVRALEEEARGRLEAREKTDFMADGRGDQEQAERDSL